MDLKPITPHEPDTTTEHSAVVINIADYLDRAAEDQEDTTA
ncbi:hypothetical protein [Nocardia salmonicida]